MIPWLWALRWQAAAWAAYFESIAALQSELLSAGGQETGAVVEFPVGKTPSRLGFATAAPVVPLRRPSR